MWESGKVECGNWKAHRQSADLHRDGSSTTTPVKTFVIDQDGDKATTLSGQIRVFLAKYVFPGTLKPAFDMDNYTSLRAFLLDATEQCPDRCKGRHDALCESTLLAIPCLAYRECIQDAK